MALQGYMDFLRAKAHLEALADNDAKPILEK
jgi:hypothetical protein